jgi:hypothetical protein
VGHALSRIKPYEIAISPLYSASSFEHYLAIFGHHAKHELSQYHNNSQGKKEQQIEQFINL